MIKIFQYYTYLFCLILPFCVSMSISRYALLTIILHIKSCSFCSDSLKFFLFFPFFFFCSAKDLALLKEKKHNLSKITTKSPTKARQEVEEEEEEPEIMTWLNEVCFFIFFILFYSFSIYDWSANIF